MKPSYVFEINYVFISHYEIKTLAKLGVKSACIICYYSTNRPSHLVVPTARVKLRITGVYNSVAGLDQVWIAGVGLLINVSAVCHTKIYTFRKCCATQRFVFGEFEIVLSTET